MIQGLLKSVGLRSVWGHLWFHASPDPADTAGGRLDHRRARWRSRPAGTEADHFNCKNEEARDLTTNAPKRGERSQRETRERAVAGGNSL